MQKVKFRYSKSEMVAFLLYRGLKYTEIEVNENPRYRNKYKVFFIFEEDRDKLIELQNEYNSNSDICLNDYIAILFDIKKEINAQINALKIKNIKC